MQNAARKRISFTTLLAIVLSCVFALSMIPLFATARYDAPDSDDLLYGQDVQAAFAESGAPGALFSVAAEVMQHHRAVNHGRFAASYLGAVFLGAAGLAHYFIVPGIMLIALVAATLFFTYVLLCRVLDVKKNAWLALSMMLLLFCVQLMPSPAEGLFWFTGALIYTLYYALALTLAAWLLLLYRAAGRGARTLFGLMAVLTAFLVSGLGFTLMIAIDALLAGYLVLVATRGRRALLPWSAVIFIVFTAGCVYQLMAPGITVRAGWEQALYGYQPMGVAQAIAASFVYAACMLLNRLDGGMLLFIALTCVLCAGALKRSAFRFRLPGLVLALSFCLYATLFTASLYATSSMGPYRQWNVMYFVQFFFWGINAAYCTGWCIRRVQTEPGFEPRWSGLKAGANRLAAHRVALLSAVGALMLSAVLVRGVYNAASVAALRELVNGSAQQRYETRMEEIAEGLGDSPGERTESRIYIY